MILDQRDRRCGISAARPGRRDQIRARPPTIRDLRLIEPRPARDPSIDGALRRR